MDYKIETVEQNDKDILYKLLQFALYDGSKFINNNLNKSGEFEYKWFDNYFTDNDRYAYFIKTLTDEIIGFIMINSNVKLKPKGKSIAEFLILPTYRRNHIGQKVVFQILNMYKGYWEIEPIKNSAEALKFWGNTISKYTTEYKLTNNIFSMNNGEI